MIQETLRTASILSFTFREAVEDVEFEGYFIPKGWKVLPLFRSIHHCADFFPQPQKFDPSRFEVSPQLIFTLCLCILCYVHIHMVHLLTRPFNQVGHHVLLDANTNTNIRLLMLRLSGGLCPFFLSHSALTSSGQYQIT